MSGSGFALLLGFALVKIALGLTLVYLGLRGGDERGEPIGALAVPTPPRVPPRRESRRARGVVRGGPRSPRRGPGRVRA